MSQSSDENTDQAEPVAVEKATTPLHVATKDPKSHVAGFEPVD